MIFRTVGVILAGIGVLVLVACGPKAVAPKAELDSPGHHVKNGNKLLLAGKIDAAWREFSRANELDPKYAPAYVGMGLVYSRKGQYENSFKVMKKATRYAQGDDQNLVVHVGYMQAYTQGAERADKNWLKEAEDRFSMAVSIRPDAAEAYYYMGVAYKKAYQFQKAVAQFAKVVDLDQEYAREANRQRAHVQQIQQARPGSVVAQKVALLDHVTRAHMAALLVSELELGKILQQRLNRTLKNDFKSPDAPLPAVTDIDDHLLKADIDTVIAVGIKGLKPYPDNTYKPDKIVTRAEFAMMIEDILVKMTGDPSLATKFSGSESPFPDLRNDLPFFNAAMVCTTRNILAAKDVDTGEFDPMGPISGAEALLSIRSLRSQF